MKYLTKLSDFKTLIDNRRANYLQKVLNAGFFVCEGFVLNKEAYKDFKLNKNELTNELSLELTTSIQELENKLGRTFGGSAQPLLLSIENNNFKIDNIGLNKQIVYEVKIDYHKYYKTFYKYIADYACLVHGVSSTVFTELEEKFLNASYLENVDECDKENLNTLLKNYLEAYNNTCHESFPENAGVQIIEIIRAIYTKFHDKIELFVSVSNLNIQKFDENTKDKRILKIHDQLIKLFLVPTTFEYVLKGSDITIYDVNKKDSSSKANIDCLLALYDDGKIDDTTFIENISLKDYENIAHGYVEDGELLGSLRSPGIGVITGKIVIDEKIDDDYIYVTTSDDFELEIALQANAVLFTDEIVETFGVISTLANDAIIDFKSRVIAFNQHVKEGEVITLDLSNEKIFLGAPEIVKYHEKIIKRLNEFFLDNSDVEVYSYDKYYIREKMTKYLDLDVLIDNELQNEIVKFIVFNELDLNYDIYNLAEIFYKKYCQYQSLLEADYLYVKLFDFDVYDLLPHVKKDALELALSLDIPYDKLKDVIVKYRDNRMQGAKMCIHYPVFYQAVMEAIVKKQIADFYSSKKCNVTILFPDVVFEKELLYLLQLLKAVENSLLKAEDFEIVVKPGLLLNKPRLLVLSETVSSKLGAIIYDPKSLSMFLADYDENLVYHDEYAKLEIVAKDARNNFDRAGLGKLIAISNQFAKQSNIKIKTGILGNDYDTKEITSFSHNSGLDFIVNYSHKYEATIVGCLKAKKLGGQ